MIFKRLLNIEYLQQNFKNDKNSAVAFLVKNNLLFKSENYYLEDSNQKESLYSYSSNTVNIPNNFYKNDNNYQQFLSVKNFLNDKSLAFIIKHEFGHLNHHQFLSLEHNIYSDKFEYKTLNSNSNYIKTDTSLDRLFDRTLSGHNPIDDFLHINFTESYADAYAGLTSYLEDKNADILDKIYDFRLNNLDKLKNNNSLNIKINKYDSNTIEIYTGNLSTSRYSNYLISKYIKDNIVLQLNFDNIDNLSIDIFHSLIQLEVLKSLQKIVKKEITENSLFNKDFQKYLLDKNKSINDYFFQFESGINEYKDKICLSIIQGQLLDNNKNKIYQLIDFHSNNISFIKSNLFSSFLDTEQEEYLFNTISKLQQKKTLEDNKLNLSKFIINKYIMPESVHSLFIHNLKNNDTVNINHNFIIQSLDINVQKYLLNSYNIKNNTNIPTLHSYSNNELIENYEKKLNNKDKKTFNDLLDMHNIKVISTPYLSSTFSAKVLNEQTQPFILKSKNEILTKISKLNAKENTNIGSENSDKKFKI